MGNPSKESQPAVWTVETWRVADGRERHFLGQCQSLTPGPLVLYRDLEQRGMLWSPAKWESLDALRSWKAGKEYLTTIESLTEDVVEHHVYLMRSVPGFP